MDCVYSEHIKLKIKDFWHVRLNISQVTEVPETPATEGRLPYNLTARFHSPPPEGSQKFFGFLTGWFAYCLFVDYGFVS